MRRFSSPEGLLFLTFLLAPALLPASPRDRARHYPEPQVEPVEEDDLNGITEITPELTPAEAPPSAPPPADITDQTDSLPLTDTESEPAQPAPFQPATGIVPKDAPISVSDSEPGELPIDSFGLLDSGNDGFGEDLWQNSNRQVMLNRIQSISAGIQSHALREIFLRLMLTRAPLGNDSGNHAFLLARAKALSEAGMGEKALEMINALPAASLPRELALLKTDILLFSGQKETMCEFVRESLSKFDDSQWMTRLIFCQALEGKTDELALSLSLLKEQRGHISPLMMKLHEHMAGADAALAPYPASLPPAELGMLLLAGIADIPPALLDKAPLSALALVAENKDFAAEIRAIAAEKLVLYGAAPVETLAKAYNSFSFPKEELTISLKDLGQYYNARGSALMYQAQAKVKDTTKRRALIRAGMQVMEKSGLRGAALRLYGTPAKEVAEESKLNPGSKDFFDIACALLANGEVETVHTLLQRGEASKSTPESWLISHMVQLADGTAANGIPIAPQNLFGGKTDARAQRAAQRLQEVMEALGTPVEAGAIAAIRGDAPPSESLRSAFEKARASESKGETLLLSVLLLQNNLHNAPDNLIADVIRAWMNFGLPSEARALALDALLAVQ